MLRKKLLLIILLIVGCDNSTEPSNESIIGTWNLTTMKLDGEIVNPDEHYDVVIIILFNFGGIGTVWVEDQGTDAGSIPFVWHTNGSQLTLQLEGEDAVSATYSISDNTFNLLFSDGWELIYTKQ